jgi:prolyl-tRNA synthetase
VHLDIPIIADDHARALSSFVCGANQADHHYQHAAWNRDATCTDVADLRNVRVGDTSPDGLGVLQTCRGIEVGHIFQLGDKYTRAMHADILDETGTTHPMLMGCYGLGISRVVAAAIEQHHDQKGILWPQAMAPFQLVIIPINTHRVAKVQDMAEALYVDCIKLGIDVLLDDRLERPGVLFADSDLIGIPHRIVISERGLDAGTVEYKARIGDTISHIETKELSAFIAALFVKA